jgi:predicted small lipoprotein YifL
MKRVIVLMLMIACLFSLITTAGGKGNLAAAPNSGDGVSDGSGFDIVPGSQSDDAGNATGPAPNSGDGIPDGSGM